MRFTTLDDWLSWQETLHPSEIELGLERVATVLEHMGLGTPAFTVVTVAGTNGKGSSVALLEAVLWAAGYSVGSYASPHLLRYNERIRINREPVDDQLLCEAFERVDEARGDTSLTYFEFGTLAAIDLLQQARVDIAILEVGMGGRLDAVNVLDPDVALITAIDVDHQQWLGEDREAIGREKAGIMRPGRPVVCSDPSPPQSLLDEAQRLGAQLLRLGVDFRCQTEDDHWDWLGFDRERRALPLPALRGAFQLDNAAGVVAVLEQLQENFPVEHQALRRGLLEMNLPGRFQVLPGTPVQILDVAHNPQSARALAQNLASHACSGRTLAVCGMLADKDISAVLDCLRDRVDGWYFAGLDVPRGAPAARLQEALGAGRIFDSVLQARTAALADAGPEDRVLVFGSFYTVAAALASPV